MLTPDNALQISSQFDAQLVALGNWSLEQRRVLNRWLDQISAEQKGRMAAQVIALFALDLLKNDVSIEGRVRIKRLQSAASLLERLVFTTRELEKKFYRDHINHMLKVALLARAIAIKKPFCLDESQLNTLTLASIFHDIAYPMSECGRIFNETLRALKDCYATAELFRNTLVRETKIDIESLALLVSQDTNKVRTMLRQMNHGLLGAIEFQGFLESENDLSSYSKVIRAITLHDPDFETEINPLDDPIVGLLIMADELQDWGRPTDQEVGVIPRIEDFVLKDGQIRGRFVAGNYSNFSVLKQVCSKIKSLQRLSLDSNKFEFSLIYDVQGFVRVDLCDYEYILQVLFNSIDKDLMDPSSNIDLSEASLFEKDFFGIEITVPIKKLMYELLSTGKLSEKTILRGMKITLNESQSEMIFSSKILGLISAIELSNSGEEHISARVITDLNTVKGNFYPNTKSETLELSQFLAAEIRFINYMTHEIGGSRVDFIKGFPKLEGLAEASVVEKASERLGVGDFLLKYRSLKLRSVLNCLKNHGCFLFS